MTAATLAGALVTAGVLGITHAIEPDHVAGISSLAGGAGDSRLSAITGACFSLGHVALVVVWLAVLALLGGRGTSPGGFESLGTIGAALLLAGLGTVMAVGGLRTVARTDEHSHDGVTHEHLHVHLPLPGVGGHDDAHDNAGNAHEHGHGTRTYLKISLLGALFTLSPPLSMIAFAGTLFPRYGLGAVSLAVVVYAVSITLTMSAVGVGVGTVFGTTRTLDARAYGAVRAVAGVAVVALAAAMLAATTPLG